jgi:phage-related baseplate assembly protein
MSSYTALDLSRLPAPAVVESLDFEAILAEMIAALITAAPELAAALAVESEPLVKLLQVCAYRETLLRARINDAGRAVMLAYAVGADLDNLAALFGVARLTLQPGDAEALPPVAPVLESDTDLRRRTQLSLEGFSTAGPRGAYQFHALKDGRVKDVSVTSPTPGTVLVSVLARAGDGTSDAALVGAVSDLLNDDFIRPLNDNVIVQSAAIVTYAVTAQIAVDEGPDNSLVLADAVARLSTYLADQHGLGRAVRLSGIYAALHTAGVSQVTLTSPTADIVTTSAQAAWCSAQNVTVAA